MVHEIDALKNWVDRQNGRKVFLDPQAEQSLLELTPIDQHVTLLSGSESGFLAQERDVAVLFQSD